MIYGGRVGEHELDRGEDAARPTSLRRGFRVRAPGSAFGTCREVRRVKLAFDLLIEPEQRAITRHDAGRVARMLVSSLKMDLPGAILHRDYAARRQVAVTGATSRNEHSVATPRGYACHW